MKFITLDKEGYMLSRILPVALAKLRYRLVMPLPIDMRL